MKNKIIKSIEFCVFLSSACFGADNFQNENTEAHEDLRPVFHESSEYRRQVIEEYIGHFKKNRIDEALNTSNLWEELKCGRIFEEGVLILPTPNHNPLWNTFFDNQARLFEIVSKMKWLIAISFYKFPFCTYTPTRNGKTVRQGGVFPSLLYGLPNLEMVSIDESNLSKMPAGISAWKKVEFLRITRCGLRTLPKDVLLMESLKTLTLFLNIIRYGYRDESKEPDQLSDMEILTNFMSEKRKQVKINAIGLVGLQAYQHFQ